MTKYGEFKNFPEKLTLEYALEKTDACIADILSRGGSPISEMTEHLAKSRGKGIRAQLLLCSAMDENGAIPRDAVLVASAIELLHLATLVHDDVIDDAPLRRGAVTLQSKYGKKAAVIGGDYLLCVALSTLSPVIENQQENIKLFYTFSSALESICLGEYRQHVNNRNCDINMYEYLKTISGKTAALFEISAYAGALVGGCNEKQSKLVAKFGRYVGMIFQIIDDCKDYEFTEETALKPVKHDIAEGVITLPLIMAFAKKPGLRQLAQTAMTLKSEVYTLVQEVCGTGGVQDAKGFSTRYAKKAKVIISSVDHEIKRTHFDRILNKALGAT